MKNLSRREFVGLGSLIAAAGGALLNAAGDTAGKNAPNFLIFLTDDQGIGDLSTYGSADIPTPNLDALAASGVMISLARKMEQEVR